MFATELAEVTRGGAVHLGQIAAERPMQLR
jgi:hypothetical protein